MSSLLNEDLNEEDDYVADTEILSDMLSEAKMAHEHLSEEQVRSIYRIEAKLRRAKAARHLAIVSVPQAPPPADVDADDRNLREPSSIGLATADELQRTSATPSDAHHSDAFDHCAGAGLVASLDEGIAYFEAKAAAARGEGEDPPAPQRLALHKQHPPPFVMVSYQQTWCKDDWSKMVLALRALQANGWRYVWLDVLVIRFDLPYTQARFEQAMHFAVISATAVYCPMNGGAEESRLYLARPWCQFECRAALDRGVYHCADKRAVYTAHGRWVLTRFFLLHLSPSVAFWLFVLWMNSQRLDEALCHDVPLTDQGCTFAAVHPTVNLICQLLFVPSGISLFFRVSHTRELLPNTRVTGSGVLFDIGDAASLGSVSGRGIICIFEQQLAWLASKNNRWPCMRMQPWPLVDQDGSAAVTPLHARGRLASPMIRKPIGPKGERCRPTGGHAPWLDGRPLSSDEWLVPHAGLAAGCGCVFWLVYRSETTVHSVLPISLKEKWWVVLGAGAFYVYFAQRWFLPKIDGVSAQTIHIVDITAGAVAALLHVYAVWILGGCAISSWFVMLACDPGSRGGALRLVTPTSSRLQRYYIAAFYIASTFLPILLFLPVSTMPGYYIFPTPRLHVTTGIYPHCGRLDLLLGASYLFEDCSVESSMNGSMDGALAVRILTGVEALLMLWCVVMSCTACYYLTLYMAPRDKARKRAARYKPWWKQHAAPSANAPADGVDDQEEPMWV